jgi:sugar phosphate isomerase/epimerase
MAIIPRIDEMLTMLPSFLFEHDGNNRFGHIEGAREVHLHDNHGEADEHLPIGEGGFDFDRFFKLLSQFGLNPVYTIEPHEEAHLRRSLEA